MRALPVTTLACLVVTTACGGGGDGQSPARGSQLTYYETYDPRSLDPALSTDVPTGEMVTLAYDGLTQFDPDGGQHPVGSGPWRFVAWQHDDYLRFARNQDYWAGAPAADTLTVRIIPEPLTRAAEFEAGRLSVMEVPFGETARWRREHPELLLEKPALRVVYVALNNRRGPLRNVRVRQAIRSEERRVGKECRSRWSPY